MQNMANAAPDNVRRLLSEYSLETDSDSICEDLKCTLCRKLMTDPHQSGCGCKYCRECIVRYITEGNKYCQSGKDECAEEVLVLDGNVLRSSVLNRMLLRARVHCPNKPCVVICPLASMEDHLKVCDQQRIKCPYTIIGCSIESTFGEMIETHLESDGTSHSRLLVESIVNLQNDNQVLKEEVASLKEKSRVDEVARKEILVQVEEERRARKEEKENMMQEIQCLKEDLRKQNEKFIDCIKKLEKEGTDYKEDQKLDLSNQLEDQKNDLNQLKEEVKSLTQGVVDKEIVITTVGEERERIDELIRTVDSLNIGTNKVVAVGRLSFVVRRFKERTSGSGEAVYSPFFYSHTGGYKLRLRVHPGGCGDGRMSHMSIYVVVCRGEYDDVLPWPCTYQVVVSIIDQRTNEAHTTQTISHCSIASNVFKKPVDKDNPPRGWPLFISHKDLDSTDGLIVFDSVFLIATVRPNPIGTISFNIDRFNARRTANETVYSPHFYSHSGGYKLQLRVHPGGDAGCRGTHLSVYSVICKGEYDDMLSWPCRLSITVSIFNQRTKEAHATETVSYVSTSKGTFNKPMYTDNIARGWPSFLPHTHFDSTEGLIVTDSVVLLVAVTSSL